MRRTVTLDLNEQQYRSLAALAQKYPHGWHTGDLIVRKDSIERRYEADWALDLARAVQKLFCKHPECKGPSIGIATRFAESSPHCDTFECPTCFSRWGYRREDANVTAPDDPNAMTIDGGDFRIRLPKAWGSMTWENRGGDSLLLLREDHAARVVRFQITEHRPHQWKYQLDAKFDPHLTIYYGMRTAEEAIAFADAHVAHLLGVL